MSKRKSKSKRLSSLLLVLLMTAVMLVVSTYAWFTSNTNVKVDSLEVNVSTGGGLQVSTDGMTWKNIINVADITTNAYSGNQNVTAETMEPVSTIGELDSGKLKMFYGTTASDETTGTFTLTTERETVEGTSTSAAAVSTKGHYIAFDLFFRLQGAQAQALTMTGNALAAGTNSVGTEYATRIAFVKEGFTADTSAVSTYLAFNDATADDVFIWEPNSDQHTTSGKANALQNYGIDLSQSSPDQLAYEGVKDVVSKIALNKCNSTNTPDGFAGVTVDKTTAYSNTTAPSFVLNNALGVGVTKYRVYIWVEGNDVDCENGASGGDVKFDLGFSIPS